MVNRIVYPFDINNKDVRLYCSVPINKSIEARRLAISNILNIDYRKDFISSCDDVLALDRALSDFMNGNSDINVEESGTAMRLMTGIISLKTDRCVRLFGEGRQHQRPIKPLVDSLRSIGCNITYIEKYGFPPISIDKRKDVEIYELDVDCSQSSQFLSSLLISCVSLGVGTKIKVKGGLVSKSYVDMTLSCLNSFGVSYEVKDNIYTLKEILDVRDKKIFVVPEFDFSSISFIYEVVSLLPNGFSVLVKDVKQSFIQGDCYYSSECFSLLGVNTLYCEEGLLLSKDDKTKSDFIDMDMCNCPDLVLPFIGSMLGNRIPFILRNVDHLRFKESDRLDAITQEVYKLGYLLDISDNTISYDGNIRDVIIDEISLSSHNDHRIAMSLTPLLSMRHNGGVVCDSQVVRKSFPLFWDEISQLGIQTKEDIQ